jgi:hypothetical protein
LPHDFFHPESHHPFRPALRTLPCRLFSQRHLRFGPLGWGCHREAWRWMWHQH